MEPRDFLGHVLGDEGHYCLMGLGPDGERKQKFYADITQLLNAAQAMDSNELNVYFGLATLKEAGNRRADNAHQMRALFLDLDCGQGKPFADQNEAIRALREFCNVTQLPRPMTVNSGGGVHVYWPLTAPVSPSEWKPVAEKLKAACVKADFGADPAVTSDVARILRVPGTHNYKRDTPVNVEVMFGAPKAYDLAEIDEILTGYAPRITRSEPNGLFKPTPVKMNGIGHALMQKLQGNRRNLFKNIMKRSMSGSGCAQLVYCVENAETLDEPMWRAALSIAKECDDSEQAARRLSEGHPDYDPDATERKMQATAGPYSCARFSELNPGGCAGCPNFGKIKSPIVLGKETLEASAEDNVIEIPAEEPGKQPEIITIPDYPPPFFRGKTGGVYVRQQPEDPEDLPIDLLVYQNDLYYERRVFDVTMGEMVLGKLHLPNDSIRAFTMPLTHLASRDKLRETLSYQGVVADHPKKWENIMSYTNTWVSHLQATTVATDARRQFGWTDDDMTSFVIGDREIFGDRVDFNPPSSATLPYVPTFEKRGTLEGWKEQAEFYNRSGMEAFQFKIGHTIGSPLVRFFPVHVASFSLYSDGSGHGKTTTQLFGLTAYGDPGTMMLRKNDTVNAKFHRFEVYKDLPAELDEVTNMEPKPLSDLIYDATAGMQRGRMGGGSNTERVRGVPWALTLGMSSNVSPLGRVMELKAAPSAELMRLLEYHVQPYNFVDKSETDVFAASVGKHVGHVAEPFIQYIINNKEQVKALLAAVQADIDKRADLSAKNRFWSVTVAITIVSLIICRELGLLKYDIKAVTDWAIHMLKMNKLRDAEMTMKVENIVNEYVTDNYNNLLWIKSTQDLRNNNGSGAKGIDNLVVPEHEPRGKLVGRYETDLKLLYLMPKPFKMWCSNQQLNFDTVVGQLMKDMKGQRKKTRISKGTKLNLPPTDVIVIDCSQLDIEAPTETGDGGSED